MKYTLICFKQTSCNIFSLWLSILLHWIWWSFELSWNTIHFAVQKRVQYTATGLPACTCAETWMAKHGVNLFYHCSVALKHGCVTQVWEFYLTSMLFDWIKKIGFWTDAIDHAVLRHTVITERATEKRKFSGVTIRLRPRLALLFVMAPLSPGSLRDIYWDCRLFLGTATHSSWIGWCSRDDFGYCHQCQLTIDAVVQTVI